MQPMPATATKHSRQQRVEEAFARVCLLGVGSSARSSGPSPCWQPLCRKRQLRFASSGMSKGRPGSQQLAGPRGLAATRRCAGQFVLPRRRVTAEPRARLQSFALGDYSYQSALHPRCEPYLFIILSLIYQGRPRPLPTRPSFVRSELPNARWLWTTKGGAATAALRPPPATHTDHAAHGGQVRRHVHQHRPADWRH